MAVSQRKNGPPPSEKSEADLLDELRQTQSFAVIALALSLGMIVTNFFGSETAFKETQASVVLHRTILLENQKVLTESEKALQANLAVLAELKKNRPVLP